MRTWLIIIGVLVALGILLDSIRRMRNARRDSFNIDLHMQKGLKEEADPLEQQLRAELPNGGARKVSGEVKTPPRPAKSAAFLAKQAGSRSGGPGNEDAQKAVTKQEPKFTTAPSLEDTQKTRRTPTFAAGTEKPPIPLLMDADERGEVTFNDDRDPFMSGTSPVLSKPRVVPRKPLADPSAVDEEQEVIVINVMARQAEGFIGAQLLENVLTSGMRYGDMNIFHHYAPSPQDDHILYSMANILKPGIFDLNSMQSFQTPGVSFFMTLPLKTNSDMSAMDVFDKMLATSKRIAQKLDGELKDEYRSVMTGQTVEHCRQRISEFSRKKLSRSGKYTADH
jgi:cell division protein ZipA